MFRVLSLINICTYSSHAYLCDRCTHNVQLNDGADFSSNNPLFEYTPVPPAYGSIKGGTILRVTGDNFSHESARFCLFWSIGAKFTDGTKSGLNELVPISNYVTSSYNISASQSDDTFINAVTCSTPASLKPHYVHVAVVSSEDLSTLEGSLQARGELFRYHDDIKISSTIPSSSTVDGNVTVDVFGGPFLSGEGLFCMFGDVIVRGSFQSSTQVSCTTPPHASGAYSLEITQNGQDYTNTGLVFRFYHPCNINRISPKSGPSKRAGTNVIVYGENFVNATSLKCRFGSISVPAIFITSSEVHCSSPPYEEELGFMQILDYYPQQMKGKLVSFDVSNNGQDFTQNGHEFLYLEDIQASHISRNEGPSKGGTPIFISGSNFGKPFRHYWTFFLCLNADTTLLTIFFNSERYAAQMSLRKRNYSSSLSNK